jgi:hypothetical protein
MARLPMTPEEVAAADADLEQPSDTDAPEQVEDDAQDGEDDDGEPAEGDATTVALAGTTA